MAKKAYVGVNTSYTPVEYLYNYDGSDRAFIDTGVFPNANMHCIVDFQWGATNTSGGVIGGWDGNAGMLFGVNGSKFQFAFGTNTWAGSTVARDLTRHTVYMNDENGDARLDSTILASHSNVVSLTNTHKSIWLFGSNGGAQRGYVKIYSCKIYDGTTLVRDFIPVKDENGVGCMYDRANGKFYYSCNSASFACGSETGPQVEHEVARNINNMYIGVKEVYEVLDYIDSHATGQIDTGVIPTRNTKLEMKFMLHNATQGGTARVFGVENATSSSSSGGAFLLNTIPGSTMSFLSNSTLQVINTVTTAVETDYEISCEYNKITVNGTDYTGSASTWVDLLGPLYLFRCNVPATYRAYGAYTTDVRIYYCKIYEGNDLVRDFVPVRRSDGVCGLYDKIEGQFYHTVGPYVGGSPTGSVTKENEVARKVKKGYVGVSGKARQFFENIGDNISLINAYQSTNPTYQKQAVACTADYGIIAGGFDNASSNAPQKTVYAINENGVYTAGPDLTQATGGIQTTTFNGYAVFAGGKSGNNSGNVRSAKVDCYSNSLVKTTAPDLTTSVYDHAVASNSTHFMVGFGNAYNGSSMSIQSYDTNLLKTSLSNGSYARMGRCGAGNDNYIIFEGGLQGSSQNARVYDNNNVLWRLPDAFASTYSKWTCGISSNDVAYFFGVNLAASGWNVTNNIFAFDKNLIMSRSTMAYSACYINGTYIGNGRILAGGGRDSTASFGGFATYKNMVSDGLKFETSMSFGSTECQSFVSSNDKFVIVKCLGPEPSYTNNSNYIAKII